MWAQKDEREVRDLGIQGRSQKRRIGSRRTNAANCELPKVPRPFALSSAELHEAPFHGSRRRHLSAPPRGPTGHQQDPADVVTSGGGAGGDAGA